MSKIISKGDTSSYDSWTIPAVDGKSVNGRKNIPSDNGQMTAKKLQEIQKQAFAEAYQKGYQQGVNAGKNEIATQIEHLQTLFNALAVPLQDMGTEVEDNVVNLCVAMLKQLVRRELKLDRGQIVAVVKDALQMLPVSARNIQIRLNPEDVYLVNSALAPSGETNNWQLIDDPVIQRGGCRVITENSRIDATVESQVAQIITKVFGDQRAGDKSK
jgi:flagellar assembly protein FliH